MKDGREGKKEGREGKGKGGIGRGRGRGREGKGRGSKKCTKPMANTTEKPRSGVLAKRLRGDQKQHFQIADSSRDVL